MLFDNIPLENNPFNKLESFSSLDPVKKDIVTELCDVCGCSCDTQYIYRTAFYRNGLKFVIRHHPYCDPRIRFNNIIKGYNSYEYKSFQNSTI